MDKVKVRFAYRKGFRRLFLVLAFIWMALVSVMAFSSDSSADSVKILLQVGLAPVVITYLLGVAAVWVIEGFAKPE